MIEIRSLTHFSTDQLGNIGGGYTSEAKYLVRKTESQKQVTITLELIPLEMPYVKRWDRPDQEEQKRYQDFIAEGYSLAVYDNNILIGYALNEPRRWNKTLWVWEFHINKAYRRKGIGRQLMDAVIEKAR